MNDATLWRLALARQIGAAYGVSPNVAAVYIAGSVARGWADRYSDIELDVYWTTPPSDAERFEIIRRAGGEADVHWGDPPGDAEYRVLLRKLQGHVSQVWPYEDSEWSEHFYIHGVNIGVSAFLVETMDKWLADVVERFDTDDEKHMRVAAVKYAIPVHGDQLIARWKAGIRYPDELAHALIAEQLAVDESWWQCDMLAGRNAVIPLMALFVTMKRRILRILLALNRIFLLDPRFKWADRLIEQMRIAPPDLGKRLRWVYRAEPASAVAELQRLMEEVLDLVDQVMPDRDTAFAREWLSYRRVVWDQSPQVT